MTREEAIAVLRREIEPSVYEDEKSIAEAVDMAIEALSRETPTVLEKHQLSEEIPTNTPTDLISRADVLEGLKHSTAYLHDDIYTIVNRIPSAETTGALDDAIAKYVADGLMELPSADRPTGWIPVSERSPENSGCVLISIAGDIEFGAYDRQNSDWAIWRDGYWDEGKRADAWMPLPEPYREDGE